MDVNFNVMQIDKVINEDLIYDVATKTQYSGYENHKKLILLTDYISKKYLIKFAVKIPKSPSKYQKLSISI